LSGAPSCELATPLMQIRWPALHRRRPRPVVNCSVRVPAVHASTGRRRRVVPVERVLRRAVGRDGELDVRDAVSAMTVSTRSAPPAAGELRRRERCSAASSAARSRRPFGMRAVPVPSCSAATSIVPRPARFG
jgi:hypothetical protein